MIPNAMRYTNATSEGHLILTNNGAIWDPAAFTTIMLVKWHTAPTGAGIRVWSQGTSGGKRFQASGGTNPWGVHMSIARTGGSYGATSSLVLTTNRWYWMAATWATGAGPDIYLSDFNEPLVRDVASTINTGTTVTADGTAGQNWGRRITSASTAAGIDLAFGAYFTSKLSLAELQGVQQGRIPKSCRVLLYAGDNGEGKMIDYSGYGNHATAEGTIPYPVRAYVPAHKNYIQGRKIA